MDADTHNFLFQYFSVFIAQKKSKKKKKSNRSDLTFIVSLGYFYLFGVTPTRCLQTRVQLIV